MIDLIKQFEAVPADYPDAPAGLSTAAAALDAAMIWARIEAYTSHRWTVREVVWTLTGGGAINSTRVLCLWCRAWRLSGQVRHGKP